MVVVLKEKDACKMKATQEQSLTIIPHKEWLTFTEVLLYANRSSAWFYKMKKDYLIVCSETGYYRRRDIDRIFKAQTFADQD